MDNTCLLYTSIADGKIRYDGINITKIKKDDLRRSMGVVLQEDVYKRQRF